jgi:hypothetical protein
MRSSVKKMGGFVRCTLHRPYPRNRRQRVAGGRTRHSSSRKLPYVAFCRSHNKGGAGDIVCLTDAKIVVWLMYPAGLLTNILSKRNVFSPNQRRVIVEMRRMVSSRSTVVATGDQVSSDLKGEVAILNLKAGVYYGLDDVGARIWTLLQEPKTVSEIRDVLLQEYDVEADRCKRDLLALLQRLVNEGLVEVEDAPSG